MLGAMLLSRDAIAVVVEQVSAEDFYKPSHAHIFAAITSLYARGEPADYVTVPEELRRVGVLDASGGAAALMALQANTPAISSAGRYARIVQEHALLRRLIGVAHEIAEIGYEVPGRRRRSAGSGRGDGVRCRSAAQLRHGALAEGPLDRESRATRPPLRQGRDDHRRAHRVRRARPPPVGSPAVEPGRCRRPSVDGQDGVCPRAGGPRRLEPRRSRPLLLTRDEPPRDRPAGAGGRGTPRRHQASQRAASRKRLAAPLERHRAHRHGAPVHRRQPQCHHHGHSGQGSADAARRTASASSSSTTSSS